MPQTDPRLRAALEDARRETSQAVSSLRDMAASIRKEHEQFRSDRDKRAERRAKAARAGELGPDMARLQQDVDLRRTTWADVLEGRDTSASAHAARANITRSVEEMAVTVRRDPDFVREDLETRRRSEALQAELADDGR